MSFWEWLLLLCTAPLWAPFALFAVCLLLEIFAMACVVLLAVGIATWEAIRK